MRYLWTEDTYAGLHFWELVNQIFFNNELVVESKGSNTVIRVACGSVSCGFDIWSAKAVNSEELLVNLNFKSIIVRK